MSRNLITVTFPGLELDIRERPLVAAMGRVVARETKKSLRRGRDIQGHAIEPRDDGGRPLFRSGQLIKSIKPKQRRLRGRWVSEVWATGTRSDAPRLGARNGGLLAVMIFGRRTWAKRPRNPTLMMYQGSPVEQAAAEAFDAALQKDLDSGRSAIRWSRRPGSTADLGARVRSGRGRLRQ